MDRLVAFAVSRRYLMVGLFAAVLIGGLVAFQQLNIEAYPDPTPPMVDVVTQSPGLSAEEIERYITIPLETQVAGIKNLKVIRTISLYGLSDVKLQFSFDYTYDQALQQVLNRLSQLSPLLNNAQPQISPLSPIGEIYRYRLVGLRARPQDPAGLGPAAPLPRRAGGDRCHRLGWQDEDL
jgi:cobalt-zinc-cadmium resistance protein CzcA